MFRDVITQFLTAASLLTRLPLPGFHWPEHPSRAVWAFPLAGLLVGFVAILAGVLALRLGLSPEGAAALALGAQILATGALHEDGLADTADGFWGGSSPERRLEIMRDSHVGSYGVLALILFGLLRWLALSLALGAGDWRGILVAATLSRAVMPPVMAFLPQARDSGLARSMGATPPLPAALSVAIAFLIGLFLLGSGSLPMWPAAMLAAGGVAWIARVKIGGQTGDVLGAVQQSAEVAVLLALTAKP